MISPETFAKRLISSPGNAEEQWQSEWSKKLADEMRGNVAVDTGFTRSTIRVTPEGVEVGGASVFLERGTANMAPQPFVGPSVDRLIRPAAADAGKRAIDSLT